MGLQSPKNSFANWKLGLFTGSQSTGLNLNEGLDWYYDLEEASSTRFDSGLVQLDLTQGGTVGVAAGIIDNAASYDGSAINKLSHIFASQYVLSSFTFTGWVYLSDQTADRAIQYIGNAGSANVARAFELKYENSSDSIVAVISNGAGQSIVAQQIAGAIPANTWVFWAVRYDNDSGDLELRLDGQAFTIVASIAPQSTGDQSFVLGNKVTDSDAMFGRIDEVGGWDRKLTDGEIEYLYNGGVGQRPIFFSNLEDDSGNVLEDDNGNALFAA